MKKINLKTHVLALSALMISPIVISNLYDDESTAQSDTANNCSCSEADISIGSVETSNVGLSLDGVGSNIADGSTKYVYRLKNDVSSNKINYSIKDLNHKELITYMRRNGFVNIDNLSLHELRRLNIAYNYDALFWDMHERTGFPVSLFFAYFVIEATRGGIETDLWANHWNPGGIKYRNGSGNSYVYKDDDCNGMCKFASVDNYASAVKLWSSVFNADRYELCKSEAKPLDICKCIKDAGYHADKSYKIRADIMKSYWSYRKNFPRNI